MIAVGRCIADPLCNPPVWCERRLLAAVIAEKRKLRRSLNRQGTGQARKLSQCVAAYNATCDLLATPFQKPACVCSQGQVLLAPLEMCSHIEQC